MAPRVNGMGGNKPGARPKNSKQAFKNLSKEFRPYRTKLIIISIVIVIGAVLQIFVPVLINYFASQENLSSYMDPTTLLLNWRQIALDFGLVLGFYVLSSILSMIALQTLVVVANDYGYKLRNRIKAKLDRVPLSYFDKHSYGEILSRGTNDVDAITQSLNQIIYQTLHSIFLFVGVLIAMFIIS